MNEQPPISGEIVAKHTGASSLREWDATHEHWLHPGDYLVKDANGDLWHVHCRKLG